VCRAIEDIAVVYLGSAIFKISRLTFIGLFIVHLFACIFYRIKLAGADSDEEADDFYLSRNIEEDVRGLIFQLQLLF
jgi:hypothetical protein